MEDNRKYATMDGITRMIYEKRDADRAQLLMDYQGDTLKPGARVLFAYSRSTFKEGIVVEQVDGELQRTGLIKLRSTVSEDYTHVMASGCLLIPG